MTDDQYRFPTYTIGEDAYEHIDAVTARYGATAVIIGGHRALAAAEAAIRACTHSVAILRTLYYGGEASYENVARLAEAPAVLQADMLFAVGGGKALDTAKCLAVKLGKPVFTFPTIASNCAASTSVAIMYHPDGRFREPFFFADPPAHVFIQTTILSRAPDRYLWAGMGDSLAKYLESEMSGRGEVLPSYIMSGIAHAREAYDVILQSGRAALAANRSGQASVAFALTAKAVIVTVGMASILLCTDRIIDYNTGLAHAVFYAMTAYPHIERDHLHGEVVGFGCLVLALVDQNPAFATLYDFARWCGLPTQLSQLEFDREATPTLLEKVLLMKDIEHNPYPITIQMLQKAFDELEKQQA